MMPSPSSAKNIPWPFLSIITQSQVFIKHLCEGVSQKASLSSLQLPLLIVFFIISPLPKLLIAKLPEEDLRHLGGVGDVCVHSVRATLPLSLFQTLDQQPAQALPAIPGACHQPADPAYACSFLAVSKNAADYVPLAVCHPNLTR